MSQRAKGGYPSFPCKILCTKGIDVFPEYQPIVGKIYDAMFIPSGPKRKDNRYGNAEFCVVDVKDKKIVLRKGEYRLLSVEG